MKKEGKDMFFLRSSSPPAAQGLFTRVAPARRVWGDGGHAYLRKNISLPSFSIIVFIKNIYRMYT